LKIAAALEMTLGEQRLNARRTLFFESIVLGADLF
jgi:hypothetical protein